MAFDLPGWEVIEGYGIAIAATVDPLAYGVDGLRSAFIATTYFGLVHDVGALVAFATVFLGFGSWCFSRIQV